MLHLQLKLPSALMHRAFTSQPPLLVAHSFTSSLHRAPVQPLGQMQLNEFTKFWHSPSFSQGDESHSLMSVSQFTPVNPG